MTDPPPAREGDPPANPVSNRVPVVETIPSTSSSDSSARPTPFQILSADESTRRMVKTTFGEVKSRHCRDQYEMWRD